MRVFFDVPFDSRGVRRVAFQLAKYLPDEFEIATDPRSADVSVIHVIGRHDHMLEQAVDYTNLGHKYAVIQYVLQSSRNPNPLDWLDFWKGAKVFWSYYDLKEYVPDMYHTPLAADPDMFYKEDVEKKYLLGTSTSGMKSYAVECIGEARLSVYRAKGEMVYVGETFGEDPVVKQFKNISDPEMRSLYNQSHWWSSLRRLDGFELPAVEALLCGTRPIMFDTPNYRQWFDGLAEFIPESSVKDTSRHLTRILDGGAKPVTPEEIEETKKRFNWGTICKGFWERCQN